MQPFNYQLQVQDPFKSVLGAVQLGEGIRSMEAKRQQDALAQQRQQEIFDAIEKVHRPDATYDDYQKLSLLSSPEQAKSVRETWTQRSEIKNRDDLNFTGQVYSAFRAQKPEIALDMLDKKIMSLENNGEIESAKALKVWRDVGKENAQSAEDFFGITLTNIPGGEKVLEGALKLREAPVDLKKKNEEVRKFGVDINLTEAQIKKVQAETKKLGTEQQKAILELKALEETGGVDPAKMFDKEAKIRNEYQKRTGKYQELKGTFQNINSSAEAQTGPGDIALITSFMKMLDPGSVVRETEFATARDTAGLYAQLVNNLQKAKDGKFLNPKQRGEYVSLSRQYLNASEKQAKQEENNLRVVVKNYKLNPENIFGAGPESAPAAMQQQSESITLTTPNGLVISFPNQQAADAFKRAVGM